MLTRLNLTSMLCLLALTACATPNAQPQPSASGTSAGVNNPAQVRLRSVQVSTLAGQGEGFFGYEDGKDAYFYHPSSVSVLPTGEVLVLDRQNHRIRKVMPDGSTSTFWGDGERGNRDGVSGTGRFNQPVSLLALGSEVLIADAQNHNLRRLRNGELTTLAGISDAGFKDGPVNQAAFNWPSDVVRDQDGTLYVSDRYNHAIRKISPEGIVSTLAGNGEAGPEDGKGASAKFNEPMALIFGPDRHLYVADSKNHLIRKVSLTGEVSTFAGTGLPGSREDSRLKAEFREPSSLLFGTDGSLFVSDRFNHRIRVISPEGQVTTLAGTGKPGYRNGNGADAMFSYPFDLTFDSQQNILVADHGTHSVRKIAIK